MAIAAQRFKFLDQETNVGTIDFTSITDNSVYSAVVETADSAIAALKEGDSLLGKLNESIDGLLSSLSNATTQVMRKIKDALNAAIDKLLNQKLPGFVSKMLDSLKALDLGGVKAFFGDLLRVGSAFLCNNLDFIKSFMLGYSLTENILSGLLIGLLLSWLDRYCKGFSKEEVAAATNKGKLGMLFKYDGVTLSPSTVLGKFTGAYADLVRASKPYANIQAPDTSEFLTIIKGGDIRNSIKQLRNAEINSTQKQTYLRSLETELTQYTPGSPEYNNLLYARGQLLTTPMIQEARLENAQAYSSLNDTLGSIALNLKEVELSQINAYSLSEIEQSMLEQLKVFKANVSANSDIQTRSHETGAFSNFDFSQTLPDLTQEQLSYLETQEGLEESHRYNNLHPTTEVFTEFKDPTSRPLSDPQTPTSFKEPPTSTGSEPPAHPSKGAPYRFDPVTNTTKDKATLNHNSPKTEPVLGQALVTGDIYLPEPKLPGTCHV